MILTAAAFLAYAAACAPGLDPDMLLTLARKESGLDTAAVHYNKTNGTTDYGLMQINSANFGLLNIASVHDALDPCRSLTAAADLYKTLSRYNSGRPLVSLAYARSIIDHRHTDTVSSGTAETVPPPCEPDPTGWHVRVDCPAAHDDDDTSWHSTAQRTTR